MTPAEDVLAVPELLELITSYLDILDVLRLVRVNSWCYRNTRSSIPIKKHLWYLPPDRYPESNSGDTEESLEHDNIPTHQPVQPLQGNPQNAPAWRNHANPRRQPFEPKLWPHPLNLKYVNPILHAIFPGCAIRNLSNGTTLLTIASLPKTSARVRSSWKAMLLTLQRLASIHIEPAALYSPPKYCPNPDPEGDGSSSGSGSGTMTGAHDNARLISPLVRAAASSSKERNGAAACGPPAHPLGENRWIPERNGWLLDIEAHLLFMESLRKMGEQTTWYGWGVGSVNALHWTEYIALRRHEYCDGWIWGSSLEEWGSDGLGLGLGRGPRYGYFEQEILADEGLVRCGQVARELKEANWYCWIIKATPALEDEGVAGQTLGRMLETETSAHSDDP